MDTEHLLAFDHVVRTGSFSRAAWALDLSQPTISARIQSLEQALGGPLFFRQGRRIALTPLGESFLPYARRALSVLEEGIEAARQGQGGERGRLTAGVVESLAGRLLAGVVARFHRAYPCIHFFLRSGGTSDIVVEHLHDGVVEIGLLGWPCDDQATADLLPVCQFREPVILAVPRTHPLAARRETTIDELCAQGGPLLTAAIAFSSESHALLRRLKSAEDRIGFVPLHTARHLLRQGIGTGFFPLTFIQEELEAGHAAEVRVADLPPQFREFALVRHPRRETLSAAAENFASCLREEARGLLISPAK